MNDLWKFEPAPAIDSVFAATLAAAGGESLVLRDADGMPVFTLRVEIDRSLSISPALDSAWGVSVNLVMPEVSRGFGVGFEINFGAEHLHLAINKVPCFSDRLPGGPRAIRTIGALGDWTYPCTWPLRDPVPAPVIPADLYGGDEAPEEEGGLTLVLGARSADYLRHVTGRVIVVDPDPVLLQAAARALAGTGAAKVVFVHGMPVLSSASRRSVTRVYFNALDRSERKTTPVREPSWLSYTTPVVTLDAIERAFGRPTAIFVGDETTAEMLHQGYPFEGGSLSQLLMPLSAGVSQWLSPLGFNRFQPVRRRTLQYAGMAAPEDAADLSFNVEGLEKLAALSRPQDDPLLLLCSR